MLEQVVEATKAGDVAEVRRLLDENPELLAIRPAEGPSLLLLAVYYGRREVVELLRERGAPLDIFEAAAIGDLPAVKCWLAKNPELANAYAADGFQPLGLASFFGHEDVARELLARGADPDSTSRNSQGVRPLHSALARRHMAIAKMLISAGADVNASQESGFTPLHGAALHGDRAMVELLLAKGADAGAKTKDGKTPADVARAGGHEEVAALLGNRSNESAKREEP